MGSMVMDRNIPILGQKPPAAWKFADNLIGITPTSPIVCVTCATRSIIIPMDMLVSEILKDDNGAYSFKVHYGCAHCGALHWFIVASLDQLHIDSVIKKRIDRDIGLFYVLPPPKLGKMDMWATAEIKPRG
jgi:hypothetical protein